MQTKSIRTVQSIPLTNAIVSPRWQFLFLSTLRFVLFFVFGWELHLDLYRGWKLKTRNAPPHSSTTSKDSSARVQYYLRALPPILWLLHSQNITRVINSRARLTQPARRSSPDPPARKKSPETAKSRNVCPEPTINSLLMP